jgi:hypothetical protein
MFDKSTPTIERRRDEVRIGDVIRSSHGYRLLITRVWDGAENRTDERHVELGGRLHVAPEGIYRNERYPAKGLVTVERPTRCFNVVVAKATTRSCATVRYDYVFAVNEQEAGERARVFAAHEFGGDDGLEPYGGVNANAWQVERVEEAA